MSKCERPLRPCGRWRPLLTVLALLALTCPSGSASPREAKTPERFCHVPGTYDAWLDFHYQGRRFSLPAAYADNPWAYQNGRKQTGFLGRVRLPDFAPMAYSETLGKIRKGLRDWSQFLITDYRPLAEIAQIEADLGDGGSLVFDKTLDDYPHAPGPHGLTEIVYEIAGYPHRTFFQRDETGEVRTVIVCMIPGSASRPDCQHMLTVEGFDVLLTYEAKDFAGWKTYDEQARSLVSCALERGARLVGRGIKPVH